MVFCRNRSTIPTWAEARARPAEHLSRDAGWCVCWRWFSPLPPLPIHPECSAEPSHRHVRVGAILRARTRAASRYVTQDGAVRAGAHQPARSRGSNIQWKLPELGRDSLVRIARNAPATNTNRQSVMRRDAQRALLCWRQDCAVIWKAKLPAARAAQSNRRLRTTMSQESPEFQRSHGY